MKRVLMKIVSCVITLLLIVALLCTTVVFAANNSSDNRFNVMIVLDASGSMNNTDPNGLRYEAISQFANLLAEHGNYLGGIVFSTNISAQQEPILINSQQDKERVTQSLKSVPASGWTNIGDALLSAVDLIEKNGDANLPSVIVFLSDGNTEMGTKDETNASLDNKAEAIQKARERNVAIYSVCLNANQTADTTEMAQISSATGGVFQEVSSAEDLREVFNTFYNLIYGTSTILLVDETFPPNGVVEKDFEIPGIGVEEVNIIIYGKTSNISLQRPDGSDSNPSYTSSDSFTMIKITDIIPGTWKIITTGVPGDQIKINMVYNTNLGVRLEIHSDGDVINPADAVKLTAVLQSGNHDATSNEQYAGYTAQLHILNAYGDELDVVSMGVVGNRFEINQRLSEGTYNFKVSITGNYLNKESEVVGPLRVSNDVLSEEEKNNTPPEPVENPVQKTVYIWPFKGGSIDIDMNTLATDAQDDDLKYKIISSSFIEDTDYSVSSDEILTIDHFSLSKGAFTIRAIDSGGLFCDIEVVVVSRNVGIMALIGIGAAALIALAIFGIMLYILLNKRFMGACYVTQYDENGNYYEEIKREKGRGRIKLSSFNLKQSGFDVSKCYFQATGKDHVLFITNKKVYGNGALDKKFRVDGNGFEVTISTDEYSQNGIRVKFVSRLNNTNYSF